MRREKKLEKGNRVADQDFRSLCYIGLFGAGQKEDVAMKKKVKGKMRTMGESEWGNMRREYMNML